MPMKVQIIYSSLSGCTRRLAEGLYTGLNHVEKSLHDLKDGAPPLDGDVLLLGYWVDKGGPCEAMRAFMQQLEGQKVGLFCTLGFWADSAHAQGSLHEGAALLQGRNTILGGCVCNGCLSQEMIAAFRSRTGGHHSATPASEARWALLQHHPTASEIALAVERFQERLTLLERLEAQGVAYPSIGL